MPSKLQFASRRLPTLSDLVAASSAKPSPPDADERATRIHLLLVEDDPEFTLIVQSIAASLEIAFTACTTAAEGLQRLDEGDIDVVVVDGLLPDRSGARLIEDIVLRQSRHPRIVFLSAFLGDIRWFRKLRMLGVERVLDKKKLEPFKLHAELSEIVGSEQRARASQPATDDDVGAGEPTRESHDHAHLMRLWASRLTALLQRIRRDNDLLDPEIRGDLRRFCHQVAQEAHAHGPQHVAPVVGRLEELIDELPPRKLRAQINEFLELLRTP